MNPYQVVKDFEAALCEYTGAKYAVTTTSCTMALLLSLRWWLKDDKEKLVSIPKRTYVSVPQSINHAGGIPIFRDENWVGVYQLKPYPVWDCARYFTSGIYAGEMKEYSNAQFAAIRDCSGQMICLSFHWSKTLSIGQGGCILHDNDEADEWFRRMRFDGRTEGITPIDDDITEIGYHCYMSPRDAAEGLSRLAVLPKHNDPLPNDNYPDLSKMAIFQ